MTGDGDSIVEDIVINAPADRIFEALTDPKQLVRWWAVEGRFRATHVESDVRPGGRWIMRGLGMNGRPFVVEGEYREIARPHVLVFTWLPDWQEEPRETVVRIDLHESQGITTVRVTHSGLPTRAGHQGWPQLLAGLKSHAEGG